MTDDAYDQATPEERVAFHSALRSYQAAIWSCLAPVSIVGVSDDKEAWRNTGTGMLIQRTGKTLVLTAWHVFAELLTRRERGDEVYFLVETEPLEPPTIAYRDKENDIVLLDVPDQVAGRLSAAAYHPGDRWPPRRVREEQAVLVSGFPAHYRNDLEDAYEFGDFSLYVPVTKVGDTYFVLQLEHDQWLSLGRTALPDESVFLGGLSGAPVFGAEPGIFELVGIVSEMGANLPLLYVKLLDRLPEVL